jgi:hypothetical protein
MGYLLCPETKWNIFHDLDILVEEEYFAKLEAYLINYPKWVQPYTNRRVIRLSERITKDICSGKLWDLTSIPKEEITEAAVGSPGGSIVVRSDVFEAVGGYDPELFFGYAPEDSFFWTKLEVFSGEIDHVSTCFHNGGAFANDPPIEVYHLDHPATQNLNFWYKDMLDVIGSYYIYAYPDKKVFVEFKRDLFMKAKKLLRG